MTTVLQQPKSSAVIQNSSNHTLWWSQWRDRLITKEDPFHVHKTLGILCLLSYIWRFSLGTIIRWRVLHVVGDTAITDATTTDTVASDDMMGFNLYPEWTLPTLGLHLALNLSSFEFHIPPKRILSGYRIWREYRFHSLVFLCRSLALMAIQWYEDTYHVPSPNYVWNLVVVMATIMAADLGSRYLFEATSSGFARNLHVHPAIKFFFSFLQIQATSGCLFIATQRYSMHFIFCMIIQVNAFLMTIRRKNLAGHYTLISIYGAMLLGGWIIGDREIARLGLKSKYQLIIIGQIAALLRLSPRVLPLPLSIIQSKYFIWPFVYCLMQYYLRPLVESQDEVPSLFYSALACNTAVVFMGIYKVIYDYPISGAENRISAKTS